MDLNKVMIIGRLTRDPELRTTPSGINVCQIGLATNFVYNNQQTGQKVEQVEYHNVVMWRKLGEIAAQYLKKGRRVYVEGRLQTRSWDGKDGQKRSRTEIVADNMIMLDGGSRDDSGFTPASRPAAQETSQAPAAVASKPAPTEDLPTIQQGEDLGANADDVRVEDIPF